MKKKICVALAIMATLSLAGCQATTRKWGGSKSEIRGNNVER